MLTRGAQRSGHYGLSDAARFVHIKDCTHKLRMSISLNPPAATAGFTAEFEPGVEAEPAVSVIVGSLDEAELGSWRA